jgi:hypothetical protein
VAAEPSEQLLRSMTCEQRAHQDTQDQQCNVHLRHSPHGRFRRGRRPPERSAKTSFRCSRPRVRGQGRPPPQRGSDGRPASRRLATRVAKRAGPARRTSYSTLQ